MKDDRESDLSEVAKLKIGRSRGEADVQIDGGKEQICGRTRSVNRFAKQIPRV